MAINTQNNDKKQDNQEKRLIRQLLNRKVKQWTSIWWKWIVIWIWLFVFILILIIFFFFFYLTNNPEVWKWIWMWTSAIKSITSVFASLLFWLLFIVFLIFWLVYIYKLLTKDTDKIKNWLWVFIIFILWTINLIFGWIVFSRINNININDVIKSQDVLIWYINFADKNNVWKILYLPMYENKNNVPLIWPISISFKLNENIFKNNYFNRLILNQWSIDLVKFELDCWNGQILEYTNYNFPLDQYCLYINKWTYNVSFKFIYNNKTGDNKELELPWKTIQIASNIEFKTSFKLNSNKNEIIVWERTDEINLDLQKIPSDILLDKNTIEISFEWNNKFQVAEWIAKYTYNIDWKYYLIFRLPNKEEYPYYIFPIRVNPSTKPYCVIKSQKNDWTYTFSVNWESPNWNIKQYDYEIKNITNSSITKKWKWEILKTNLENGSNYQITWKITDIEWNVWICKSEVKLSSKKSYKYDINIYNESWTEISYKDNEIIVNVIPTTLSLKIKDILWWKDNITEIGFDTNDDWNIDKKWEELELTIKKDQKINTIIKDIYWNISHQSITVKVEQKKAIATLNSDKYKWEAPLKIKFDASISEATDENDSIIYFNWDFGDGEKIENTRRWNLDYTYKTPWEYIAKVSVETEKWHKDTATKKIFVYSPINNSSIIFPNNLWWQVQVKNSLSIEIQTSWNVKDILWDFGDWETFSCFWRECININHTYNKKWFYKIKAKLNYLDGSPSTTTTASIFVIE